MKMRKWIPRLERSLRKGACLLAFLPALTGPAQEPRIAASKTLNPLVELEEPVYSHEPANNGAGPLWCSGSSCLARVGEHLFASGLETLKDYPPLNNCRWLLFERTALGWGKPLVDASGRTREPCPLAGFADGRLFLSANPTWLTNPATPSGPARPEMVRFSAEHLAGGHERLLPEWDGSPRFSEHSYRSLAADGTRGELILFQNIDYTHAEWSFLDSAGHWSAKGKLAWPWGAKYDKPQPIRVCYPDVALKNRAVYFCGVSDIVEPNAQWRAYKKQLTGRDWDYDFRRLFFTWTPDITRRPFVTWIEIASRDNTCGWISPGDLYVAPNGAAHLLWTERALDERLRAKFFPEAKQSYSLHYAVVRDGQVELRRTLIEGGEDGSAIPGQARFQPTPDNRLVVFYYFSGRDSQGKSISENRVFELFPGGTHGQPVRVPLKSPFVGFFTATPRAGSPPSNTLELLGQQAGSPQTIAYARIKLG